VTVGTQAAVLAGLDITMFIEFNPPHNDDWVRTVIMLMEEEEDKWRKRVEALVEFLNRCSSHREKR